LQYPNFDLQYKYVSGQSKRDLLGVKIENHFFAYVNSLIFAGSEYVHYMTLWQL